MIKRLVLLVAGVSLAQPASSEMTETSPGIYRCQAAAGQRSSVNVSQFFAGGSSMAARIRFEAADHHDRLPPNAGLTFHLDTGATARILVIAPQDNPQVLWISLIPPQSNQAHIMAAVRRSRIVEISATMARGAIFARAGNERGQIYVGEAGLTSREISCGSGRFEIELTRNPRPARPY